MPHTVEEVMTRDPVTLPQEAPVVKAAKLMRDRGIGDVLVVADDRLRGLVTDRDIVVRAVAEGRDLTGTPLATLCTRDVVTVRPDQDVAEAARLMREKGVHQLPVVVDGRPVGVVALADITSDITSGITAGHPSSGTAGPEPSAAPLTEESTMEGLAAGPHLPAAPEERPDNLRRTTAVPASPGIR